MQEIVPLVAGVAIAFVAQHFGVGARSKAVVVLVGSVAIGVIASFFSGELFVSWAFLGIDFALTLLVAGVTMALLVLRRRRLARRQHVEQ